MAKTKTKTYHKEDLRRDLLAAGRAFVSQNGHLALSLRSLAQQLGVTTAAPYHHFADKRALLLALAIEGFEDMNSRAQHMLGAKVATPLEKLIALGESYLRFAYENPRLLELMYESELTTPTLDPALLVYQRAGYELLLDTVTEALPELSLGERNMRVTGFWSTLYGLALLRNKHYLHPYELAEMPPKDVDQAVVSRSAEAALAH